MKPQRIWPVRGSRRKYSCQFSLRVRPRMDFQNVPPPVVQPGHNEEFVSRGNSFETARREGIRFKPSVRRSFRTLLRRFFAILDRRSNDRDRTQLQPCASHRRFLPSASSFAPACHGSLPPGFSQALSLQLSLPPERLSRSHVSCTASSQCDRDILVYESGYQNAYLSRERCPAFLGRSFASSWRLERNSTVPRSSV